MSVLSLSESVVYGRGTVHSVTVLQGGESSDLSALAELPSACADPLMDRTTRARFWRFVKADASGCWLWTGSTVVGGHGQFNIGRLRGAMVNRRAHRIAWTLLRGAVPDGLQVNHHCDVPACVNPAHLYVGTQLDNMRDAKERGRLPKVRRERKMTVAQVIECRALRAAGWKLLPLAHRYSVSEVCISLVCRGLRRAVLRESIPTAVGA